MAGGQFIRPVLVALQVRVDAGHSLERSEVLVVRRSDFGKLHRSIGIDDVSIVVQIGPPPRVRLAVDRVGLCSDVQGVPRDEPAREGLDSRLAVAGHVPRDAHSRGPVVPVRHVLDLVDRDRLAEVAGRVGLRWHAGIEVIPARAEIDRETLELPLILHVRAAIGMDLLNVPRRTVRD